jgi:PAN-like domain
VTSYEGCSNLCKNDEQCHAVTFRDNSCTLFHRPDEYQSGTDGVSGIKRQKAPDKSG